MKVLKFKYTFEKTMNLNGPPDAYGYPAGATDEEIVKIERGQFNLLMLVDDEDAKDCLEITIEEKP